MYLRSRLLVRRNCGFDLGLIGFRFGVGDLGIGNLAVGFKVLIWGRLMFRGSWPQGSKFSARGFALRNEGLRSRV